MNKFGFLASISLVALCTVPAMAQSSTEATEASDDTIIVTATRRAEAIERTPISVAAFSNETLETIGAKQVDDIVALTPGLDLNRTVTGSNQISIRGIQSSAGAGTTGVYIDDTPIQVSNLGFGAGTAFPEVFDLERIEVLRGPQGTLFGSGSEGGTVRFIQTSPSLKDWSGYARTEIAKTDKGAESYEIGGAIGGPIIPDVLGFRAHVYLREDGGYIDSVRGTVVPAVGNPTPVYPYANLVDFTRTKLVKKDINSSDALTARLALKFTPNDWLTLSPSISYQRTRRDDGHGSFWIAASDIGKNDFARRTNFQGSAATNPLLTQVDIPDQELAKDQFTLYALSANIDLGDKAELITNTSYFDRSSKNWLDFTFIDAFQFAFDFFVDEGRKSMSLYGVKQQNFVQEVRFQSADKSSRFNWVVGGFYADNKQTSTQNIGNNFVAKLPVLSPLFNFATAGGDPFGPGVSALVNALGVPLQGSLNSSYDEFRELSEMQYAGFAQVDYEVVDNLTLIAGVRVARNKLTLNATFRGPLNNDNPPFGLPCPVGQTCVPGSGIFTPVYVDTNGFKTAETSVTPKFGISWQATSDHLFYGTVAKGFRPAGVNARVPAQFCGADLALVGYLDGSGNSAQPPSYKSDSVWSYEAGSKNRLADGRVNLDLSAYYIKWSNIQNSVFLPTCLYSFVDNLGNATSKGIDIAVDLKPVDGLSIGGTLSYNRATYDQAVATPSGRPLGAAGSPINNNSPWRFSAYGQLEVDRFYGRVDVAHTTQARRFGETDPNAPQFDRFILPEAAFTTVNARLGARFDGVDVSLFVDNLTNAAPIFGLNEQFNRVVYTASTLRPRTIGLTAAYRF